MYYIEDEIELILETNKVKLGFFYIFRYQVDYTNKRTQFDVSCWKDRSAFLNFNATKSTITPDEIDRVISFEISDCPDFDVDPTNFILRNLVTTENSIFFGKTVRKFHGVKSIDELRENYKDESVFIE